MSESARPWTAEILLSGMTLYAAVAKNTKYGTFATEIRAHARRFHSQLEVEEWIERLKVPNATSVNLDKAATGPPRIATGLKHAVKRKKTKASAWE